MSDLPKPAHPATYYCNKCGFFGEGGPVHKGCHYGAVQMGPWWDEEQVTEAVAAAVAQERERCAHICNGIAAGHAGTARRLEGAYATRAAGQRDAANECAAAIRATPTEPSLASCGCRACIRTRGDTIAGVPREMCEMILCETCGNKRCPHATDHRHACTGSNAPGQPGSVYGSATRTEPKP